MARPAPLVAEVGGGNRSHPAAPVVVDSLGKLFVRVHHERSVPRNRLPDGLTAEDEHVEVGRTALLGEVGGDAYQVARAEGRQLSGADGGSS